VVKLYAVGNIIGCFGIKGYLKIRDTHNSGFPDGKIDKIFIGDTDEVATSYEIEDVISRNQYILIKVSSVDDRTAAEALRGKTLFVEEKHKQRLKEGTFYIHDIIGCDVYSSDGRSIGTIEDVHKFPAQDVWVIRKNDKLQMIPAVREFIKKVDVENRKIIIDLIEGLIEE